MSKTLILATASALALSGAAFAQTATEATATTDLNLRAGPGPNFEIATVIPADGAVTVDRCLAEGQWCEVNYDGTMGWAYSQYLQASLNDETVVVEGNVEPLAVTTVERNSLSGSILGATVGAVAGALVAGPVGAATGVAAATGGAVGGLVGADAGLPETTTTYITQNPVEPVYLEGEVVVGAGVPQEVTLYDVPDQEVQYAYVNGVPVAIDPETRQIVYIVR